MNSMARENWNMLACSGVCRVLTFMNRSYYSKRAFPFKHHLKRFDIDTTGTAVDQFPNSFKVYMTLIESLMANWKTQQIPKSMDVVKEKLEQSPDLNIEAQFTISNYSRTITPQDAFALSRVMRITPEQEDTFAKSYDFVNDF